MNRMNLLLLLFLTAQVLQADRAQAQAPRPVFDVDVEVK